MMRGFCLLFMYILCMGDSLARGGNLLRNSGFEAGLYPWRAMPAAGGLLNEVKVTEKDAWEGKRCVVIDNSRARVKPTPDRLVSEWFPGKKGEGLTVSAYMKADPGVKAMLGINAGLNMRQIRKGVSQKNEWQKVIPIGSGWRRYQLTTVLDEVYDFDYQVTVTILGRGRLYIDAFQVERGGLTDFHPASTADIGLAFGEPSNLFALGTEVEGEITVCSYLDAPRNFALRIEATDQYGKTIQIDEDRLVFDGRGCVVRPICFKPERKGVYRLNASLTDDEGKTVREETAPVGVIRYLDKLLSEEELRDSWIGMYAAVSGRTNRDLVMRRLGIRRPRVASYFLEWDKVQPEQGVYTFAIPDLLYPRETMRPFSVIFCLRSVPTWAAVDRDGMKITVPRNMSDYTAYLRKLVDRFGDRVKTWEIWNEPGASFTGTVAEYVALLKASYETIKGVDPTADVIGICPCDARDGCVEYIRSVLELGGLDYLDGVSFHPYRDMSPEETGLVNEIERIKELMISHGGEKPMYITEFGWCAATPPGVPNVHLEHTQYAEDVQAAYVVRGYLLSLLGGVKCVCWFTLKSSALRKGASSYALLNSDTFASPKLGVIAYNAMVDQLEGTTFKGRIDLGDEDLYALSFQKGGRSAIVAWSAYGKKLLAVEGEGNISFHDMYGNNLEREKGITELRGEPVYIHGAKNVSTLIACDITQDVLPGQRMQLGLRSGWQDVTAAFVPSDAFSFRKNKVAIGEEHVDVEMLVNDSVETGTYSVVADLTVGRHMFQDIEVCRVNVAEPVGEITPVIDGHLSEWKNVRPRRLRRKLVSMHDEVETVDSGAAFYLGWDEEALYFAIVVEDEVILTKNPAWCDRVGLTLDTRDNLRPDINDRVFLMTIEPEGRRVRWQNTPARGSAPGVKGVRIAGHVTDRKGYAFELAMPRDNFPWVERMEGRVFGFEVMLLNARGTHEGRYVWKGYRGNRRNLARIGRIELTLSK